MQSTSLSFIDDPKKKWNFSLDSLKVKLRRETDFKKLNTIGEGTYGVVYRAIDKSSGEIVALKKVKIVHKGDGFPISSVREIRILELAKHPNIVSLKEVIIGEQINSVFLSMEYCQHDLATLIQHLPAPFSEAQIKNVALQILQADFGLARSYSFPYKPMTPIVVTLWYRPPELLFGSKVHTPTIDMWGFGCIIAELYKNKTLFMGESEINQILLIVEALGTPNDDIWPGYSSLPGAKSLNVPSQPYNTIRDEGIEFLQSLLVYNPLKRLSAKLALDHDYFTSNPLPIDPSLMPTFPEFRNLKFKNINKK